MEKEVFFKKSPLKAFSYAVRFSRGRLRIMYLCVILGNAFSYVVPFFLSQIVDTMAALESTGSTFKDFSKPLWFIVAALILSEASFRIGHLIETSVALQAFDRITTHLYKTLLERPTAYFEEKFSGELNRRVEQVAEAIKFFIEYFPWEIGWPVIGSLMTIWLLATAHIYLAIAFVVWLLFFVSTSYFLLKRQFEYSKKVSEKAADLSGTVVDVLGNASLVQSFASHEYEHAYYRRYMDQALLADKRSRNMFVLNKLQQGGSVIILTLILTYIGIYLFTKGQISLGDFVIIAATIPTFTGIVWTVGETVTRSIKNLGEFKDALESLDTDITLVKDGPEELRTDLADIKFDGVAFSYQRSKEKVLDGFSLHIKAGQRVGLVGRSGAGKSTLVKLLLRSYDVTSGRIEIAGKNTSSLSLSSLRGNIAFVPQDTALFHRSLYENILYARPTASREEVMEASKRAHAHEFIEQYPTGYETLVGERGVKLSGGQRQRIALARAMLRNSPILVLDEATSSLDSESEELVQKGLQELFKDRTVLAIAHRLSTLRSMDRIVVLEGGKIVEDGAPQELLKREGGVFKGMWERQKNGFVEA
jgi:ATP-binding cassette, subfamily B, bacterial